MRICYIYREKEKNEHSIEAVFDTISASMEGFGHEVHKWYKPISWKQTFREIRQLRKENYDIYHITGDVNYLWIFFPWNKTTMTVHDIGCYKNHKFRLTVYIIIWLGMFFSSWFLKKYTAVSDLTKSDLNKYLYVRNAKVQVIPNPLSLPIHKCPKAFHKECPTILQIGTGWHKNLDGLIEAVKGIKCKIQIIGTPSTEDEQRMIDYGIDYAICHHISAEEVIRLYEECDMLYFVSRSEGFGMPIIEAQTVGRVVLTTDSEPTRTVANGAALLFDAENHEAIHDGIIRIISDDSLRNCLIEGGYQNAVCYQPERIGRLYEQFYKEVFKLL